MILNIISLAKMIKRKRVLEAIQKSDRSLGDSLEYNLIISRLYFEKPYLVFISNVLSYLLILDVTTGYTYDRQK